jgi:hypothetical protein
VEGGGFEPPKVEDRQIYSLLPLATWLPLRTKGVLFTCLAHLAGGGIRTRDLLITNQVLYQLSYTGKAPELLGKPSTQGLLWAALLIHVRKSKSSVEDERSSFI